MIQIPVLDAAQAASWDEYARVEAGIPSRVLMDAAGRAAALVVAREFADRLGDGVLVAAGHGNNGGDGWVVARALVATGVRVWAVDEERERSDDCEANRRLALEAGVTRLGPGDEWPVVGVLVDAVLGTGASGPPRGAAGQIARHIADSAAPVAAIDGPTGLDLTTGEAHGPVRAQLTLTFGGVRRGHLLARDLCGRVVVVDIGFPEPSAEWPTLVTDGWARTVLPRFEAAMHKGDRGRVLVVGGDHGMAGAAIHAASAAFAVGAGLVKVAAHEVTVAAAQKRLPDALTTQTALGPGIEESLEESLGWADAVVLGPGMGRGKDRSAFVGALLASVDSPAVIDADALHVGLDALNAGAAPRVFTPHPGEFRSVFPDLAGDMDHDRFAAAESAAAAAQSRGAAPVILLKGVPTVIAQSGGDTRVVASGNPALATGGSGDLLAGFIGAFLARGMPPGDAAALGAHVLGRAAEVAAASHGVRSTRPADVVAAVEVLWKELARDAIHAPPVLVELKPPALV
ncbi:MAG: NAD(P)H-hydrate dehydratase [Gemmatimonadales bacterium]